MEKDKVLIKHYRLKRKYGRKQLLKEFPEKKWNELGRESYWIRSMIQETKKRKQDRGRPRTSWSHANIGTVENLILSQESDPGTHLSLREIEMETGIVRASVHQIGKFNLGLVTFKLTNIQRLTRKDKEKKIYREKRLLHYMAFANLEKNLCNSKDLQIASTKQ